MPSVQMRFHEEKKVHHVRKLDVGLRAMFASLCPHDLVSLTWKKNALHSKHLTSWEHSLASHYNTIRFFSSVSTNVPDVCVLTCLILWQYDDIRIEPEHQWNVCFSHRDIEHMCLFFFGCMLLVWILVDVFTFTRNKTGFTVQVV